MKRRTLLAAPVCLWIAVAGAAPASARKCVVLSLVGNIVNVIESEPVTGSLIDRNRHASIPITDGAFDKAALLDLATSTVVASEIVAQSNTLVQTNSTSSFDPWDTLAPAAKVAALQEMLREELARVVPLLLAVV